MSAPSHAHTARPARPGHQISPPAHRREAPAPAGLPPVVAGALRTPGAPLDPATRLAMEARFGHDFGRVRVHADPTAADSAHAVGARAYTVGQDVVLGRRARGAQTLAHELAHVVQQSRGGPPPSPAPGNVLDAAAERAADAALAGHGPVHVAGASGVGLARQEDHDGDRLARGIAWLVKARNDPSALLVRTQPSPATPSADGGAAAPSDATAPPPDPLVERAVRLGKRAQALAQGTRLEQPIAGARAAARRTYEAARPSAETMRRVEAAVDRPLRVAEALAGLPPAQAAPPLRPEATAAPPATAGPRPERGAHGGPSLAQQKAAARGDALALGDPGGALTADAAGHWFDPAPDAGPQTNAHSGPSLAEQKMDPAARWMQQAALAPPAAAEAAAFLEGQRARREVPPKPPGEVTLPITVEGPNGNAVVVVPANVTGPRAERVREIMDDLHKIDGGMDVLRKTADDFESAFWTMMTRPVISSLRPAQPPAAARWARVRELADQTRAAVRDGDLTRARDLADEARGAYDALARDWYGYQEKSLAYAGKVMEGLEVTREVALDILSVGGWAGLAGSVAVKLTDILTRVANGEKVDFGELAAEVGVDVALRVVTHTPGRPRGTPANAWPDAPEPYSGKTPRGLTRSAHPLTGPAPAGTLPGREATAHPSQPIAGAGRPPDWLERTAPPSGAPTTDPEAIPIRVRPVKQPGRAPAGLQENTPPVGTPTTDPRAIALGGRRTGRPGQAPAGLERNTPPVGKATTDPEAIPSGLPAGAKAAYVGSGRENTREEQLYGLRTPETVKRIRQSTPTDDHRAWAQKQLPKGAPDPALPGRTVTGPAQADHVLAADQIRKMPGAAQLTDENLTRVLNSDENIQALSPTANQSKGGLTHAEWTRYKKGGVDVDPEFRARGIAAETRLRVLLQARVNYLLRQQWAGGIR